MFAWWQGKAVSIEGHPDPAYNDVYTHESTHEGWPVLKTARGIYLRWHKLTRMWMLSASASRASGRCKARIVAELGPLPAGAHTWQVAVNDDWTAVPLTLKLLVRPCFICTLARQAPTCPSRWPTSL